jgi:hypothetical protein
MTSTTQIRKGGYARGVKLKHDSIDCQLGTAGPTIDNHEDERLKQLLFALNDSTCTEIPPSALKVLEGFDGLKRLAAALTILLTDYGGTNPGATCGILAELAPDLHDAFGQDRVLALCEEIQQAEIPEQSALFQERFDRYNQQYFAGSLPDYRVLVVYDVWYWETQRCGYPRCFPPACEAVGFIDFTGRQIFIRFLGLHTCGITMAGSLTHEMAHAATDGEHGANWKTEMARLKSLGAPVWDDDI